MLISEAAKAALKTSRCIKRKSCPFNSKIMVTPHEDLRIISEEDNKPPAKWWAPLAEDLIADDWEVVD